MTVKPQWPTAPDWAQWLAMDVTARWWWYAEQPSLEIETKSWRNLWGTRVQEAENSVSGSGWINTLEPRP